MLQLMTKTMHTGFSSRACALLLAAIWSTIVTPVSGQDGSCKSLSSLDRPVSQAEPNASRDTTSPPRSNAASGFAEPTNLDQGFSSLTTAQAQMLSVVVRRLGETARLSPAVFVCFVEEPAARVVHSRRSRPSIYLSTGLVALLKSDPDMIAWALAHEFAHAIHGHGKDDARAEQTAGEIAVSTGREVARDTGSRGAALIVARQVFELGLNAYSREIEREADETGFQLMIMAGFSPSGAVNAAKLMMLDRGSGPTSFWSTHPGWEERVHTLDNAAKKVFEMRGREAAAQANAIATAQLKDRASALVDAKNWAELSELVADWLKRYPDSSDGWYFEGLLRQARKKPTVQVVAALEKAVSLDPQNTAAWLELCTKLYKTGHRRESAYCGRDLQGTGLVRQYREEVYQDRLFVHDRPALLSDRLWSVRESGGSTLITNDPGTLSTRGLPSTQVLPERAISPVTSK